MPEDDKARYGIAEWYGKDFTSLNALQREDYAKHALGETDAELVRDHWEVLTLEDSKMRLQAAETVSREHFEEALRTRLQPLLRKDKSPQKVRQ